MYSTVMMILLIAIIFAVMLFLRKRPATPQTSNNGFVQCPDCGATISGKAPACPKCGRPMNVPVAPAAAPGTTNEIGVSLYSKSVRNAQLWITAIALVAAGVILAKMPSRPDIPMIGHYFVDDYQPLRVTMYIAIFVWICTIAVAILSRSNNTHATLMGLAGTIGSAAVFALLKWKNNTSDSLSYGYFGLDEYLNTMLICIGFITVVLAAYMFIAAATAGSRRSAAQRLICGGAPCDKAALEAYAGRQSTLKALWILLGIAAIACLIAFLVLLKNK